MGRESKRFSHNVKLQTTGAVVQDFVPNICRNFLKFGFEDYCNSSLNKIHKIFYSIFFQKIFVWALAINTGIDFIM